MHESNEAHVKLLVKSEGHEQQLGNLRSEVLRLTKERNDAEDSANTTKHKSKIKTERIKHLETELNEVIKERKGAEKGNHKLHKKLSEMKE